MVASPTVGQGGVRGGEEGGRGVCGWLLEMPLYHTHCTFNHFLLFSPLYATYDPGHQAADKG